MEETKDSLPNSWIDVGQLGDKMKKTNDIVSTFYQEYF